MKFLPSRAGHTDIHQNVRTLLLPEGSVAKAKDLAGWPEPRAIEHAT